MKIVLINRRKQYNNSEREKEKKQSSLDFELQQNSQNVYKSVFQVCSTCLMHYWAQTLLACVQHRDSRPKYLQMRQKNNFWPINTISTSEKKQKYSLCLHIFSTTFMFLQRKVFGKQNKKQPPARCHTSPDQAAHSHSHKSNRSLQLHWEVSDFSTVFPKLHIPNSSAQKLKSCANITLPRLYTQLTKK